MFTYSLRYRLQYLLQVVNYKSCSIYVFLFLLHNLIVISNHTKISFETIGLRVIKKSTTNASRVTDSLAWHPQTIKMPGSRPAEALELAIRDLITALAKVQTSNRPFENLPLNTLAPTLSQLHNQLVSLYNPPAPTQTADSVADQRMPTTTPQQVRIEPANIQRVPTIAPPPPTPPPVESTAIQRVPEATLQIPAPTPSLPIGGDNVTFESAQFNRNKNRGKWRNKNRKVHQHAPQQLRPRLAIMTLGGTR